MPDDNVTIRERYLEQMVESASPEGLLLLLVDGAVNFIRRAAFELEREHLDAVHTNLVKAQDIYLELVISLDLDAGEFADNLGLVYQFLYNLLIEANLEKNAGKIANALRLAEEIRDLWKEAVEKTRDVDECVKFDPEPPVCKPSDLGVYQPAYERKLVKVAADLIEPPSRLNITG
jgi:flagellar protein FliS